MYFNWGIARALDSKYTSSTIAVVHVSGVTEEIRKFSTHGQTCFFIFRLCRSTEWEWLFACAFMCVCVCCCVYTMDSIESKSFLETNPSEWNRKICSSICGRSTQPIRKFIPSCLCQLDSNQTVNSIDCDSDTIIRASRTYFAYYQQSVFVFRSIERCRTYLCACVLACGCEFLAPCGASDRTDTRKTTTQKRVEKRKEMNWNEIFDSLSSHSQVCRITHTHLRY